MQIYFSLITLIMQTLFLIVKLSLVLTSEGKKQINQNLTDQMELFANSSAPQEPEVLCSALLCSNPLPLTHRDLRLNSYTTVQSKRGL